MPPLSNAAQKLAMPAPKPLVIIHGWSDSSASFQHLAQLLQTQLGYTPQLINLADYISMDDEITYDDLVTALSRAWQKQNLPTTPNSVDVIVHSTGGLIIRDWLTRNFTPTTVPIKHLVMLAPANFGSPLAHKGQSFIGRVIKGFDSDKLFQVGEKLLKGLELASPYSWQLALRDRFSQNIFYGAGNILCTILIGNTGYTGVSAAANEDGTDGTVRMACANLNCAYLTADFSLNPFNPSYKLQSSNGLVAFVVLDKENHRTITGSDGGPLNSNTIDYIVRALTISDNDFPTWCKTLKQATDSVMQNNIQDSSKHGFQNTVSFVHDQFNQHVQDYFLEFYDSENNPGGLADLFHRDLITTTHAYADDNSYRSLYIDCTLLYQQLNKENWPTLNISLTALPEFNKNKNVGYRTFTDQDIGAIKIDQQQIADIFKPNRTLLMEIILKREQADEIFIFRDAINRVSTN
jgi:pimeloyl-ACP methyl ester carboxylesterase